MYILGITGGIGSGKSTVCRMLSACGAIVFDADRVARDLQVSNADVKAQIVERFGDEAYLSDGSLNRAYLAGRVFSSDADRSAINAIVHPAVGEAFRDRLNEARQSGVSLLVKEAALLLETDTSVLDSILLVDCPKEERVRRVVERDGLDRSAVEARMRAQMPVAEMKARAHRVLINSGPLVELETAVQALYSELTGEACG